MPINKKIMPIKKEDYYYCSNCGHMISCKEHFDRKLYETCEKCKKMPMYKFKYRRGNNETKKQK